MKAKCKYCSYTATKDSKLFVCDDCKSFLPIFIEFFELVEERISPKKGTILELDAQKDDVLNLLSQISFIIYNDPRLNVFFNSVSYLLDMAIQNKNNIFESDFSTNVKTVRSLTDLYDFFEESELLDIEFINELRQRKITIKPKLLRFTEAYLTGRVEEQQKSKTAHILSGYIFSRLCFLVSQDRKNEIPYNINPKTLWCTLMLLFNTIHERINQKSKKMNFTEEYYNSFLGKRGIQSTARSKIIYGMKNIDGKILQGLISDVTEIYNDEGKTNIELEIADYVRKVYEQIRNRLRDRDDRIR